jgi:hypothetical protein
MKTRSKILVMGATATGVLAIGLGAGAQRLLVKQDTYLATTGGNVGIGTASPTSKLHVANQTYWNADGNYALFTTADADRAIRLSNRFNGNNVGYASIQSVYSTTAGALDSVTGLLLNPNGGNVGVGTTAPIGPLTIGNAGVAAGSDGFLVLGKNNGSGSTRQARIGYDASFNFVIGDYGNNNVAGTWTPIVSMAWNSPANMIVTTAAGNLGIGTTAPAYKLHVNGTAAGTSWTNLSSRDYKEDIRYVASSEYDQMLAKVVEMKPARYRYKTPYTDDHSVHLGFIAEEMPRDVLSPNGKGVDTYELVTYLAGAVKAQQGLLKTQEAQLTAQREQLTAQREQLTAQREQLTAQLTAQRGEIAELRALVRKVAAR